MAKTRKERLEILKEFEDNVIGSLGKKLEKMLKDPNSTEKEKKAMQFYISQLRANVNELKGDTVSPKQVDDFFTNCKDSSSEAVSQLKSNRSWVRTIIDTLKDIANFCIKILTLGKSPQFFDTTSKPIDSAQREINSIRKQLDSFVDKAEHSLDRGTGLQSGAM